MSDTVTRYFRGAARVTDPSQVERIIAGFDALAQSPRLPQTAPCFIYRSQVAFTFRAANGKARATAKTRGYCIVTITLVNHASGATTFLVPSATQSTDDVLSGIKLN